MSYDWRGWMYKTPSSVIDHLPHTTASQMFGLECFLRKSRILLDALRKELGLILFQITIHSKVNVYMCECVCLYVAPVLRLRTMSGLE